MALKPCVECGTSISTDAPTCPTCGKRSPTRKTSPTLIPLIGCLGTLLFGFFCAVAITEATSSPKASTMPNVLQAVADAVPAALDPAGFGGVRLIGSEMASGTWRTRTASPGCYFARLAGTGGEMSEVLSNDNSDGPAIVTIGTNDAAFESRGCAVWSQDLSAITTAPGDPFGTGTYIVGVDIEPGVWRADSPESCYWARLRGFSGGMTDVIANNNGVGTVTISAKDKGFKNQRCGSWRKIK